MKHIACKTRRYGCTFLLLSALLLTSEGCSLNGDSQVPQDTQTAAPAENITDTETVTETAAPVPMLPENVDMEGKTFTILTEGFSAYEPLAIIDISAEETNGESFNDSVYNRNAAIEEKQVSSIHRYRIL